MTFEARRITPVDTANAAAAETIGSTMATGARNARRRTRAATATPSNSPAPTSGCESDATPWPPMLTSRPSPPASSTRLTTASRSLRGTSMPALSYRTAA